MTDWLHFKTVILQKEFTISVKVILKNVLSFLDSILLSISVSLFQFLFLFLFLFLFQAVLNGLPISTAPVKRDERDTQLL